MYKLNTGGIHIYKRMQKEYQFLEEKIERLSKEIKKLPEGKLIVAQSKNSYKWYCSDGHTKKYIKKQEKELAAALAKKKYLTLQLEEAIHEKRAIQFYLEHHVEEIPKSIQLITESEEYRNLLSTVFEVEREDLRRWMRETYEKNPHFPEKLTHKTSTGEYVRSKSEAIIHSYLTSYKIPFRYECVLRLGKHTYYPDFTIRHPKTGEYIYFEHFGKMDDPQYARKAFKKLEVYQEHGIIPGKNLIMTFETEQNPLSVAMVEKIIEYYFI